MVPRCHQPRGAPGLRNVLAHTYTSIDLDRLYAALTEDKTLIRDFGRIAARELAG
jgi:uncharacterized protein YutE (UPF0331/DUF86 family)